jgi:probable HAF family extracellular repeat protein
MPTRGVFANSINNSGEVVGWSCGPSEPAHLTVQCSGFYWRNGVMIDLNAHLSQKTSLQICCANDINERGQITAAAFDPKFNGGDFVPVVLSPDQDEQSAAEALPQQSALAVQRSVLPRGFLQRFGPRLLGGWNIAH